MNLPGYFKVVSPLSPISQPLAKVFVKLPEEHLHLGWWHPHPPHGVTSSFSNNSGFRGPSHRGLLVHPAAFRVSKLTLDPGVEIFSHPFTYFLLTSLAFSLGLLAILNCGFQSFLKKTSVIVHLPQSFDCVVVNTLDPVSRRAKLVGWWHWASGSLLPFLSFPCASLLQVSYPKRLAMKVEAESENHCGSGTWCGSVDGIHVTHLSSSSGNAKALAPVHPRQLL